MNSLIELIRKQEVLTLAFAFVIGATIVKLISSFIGDIISPLLGVLLGLSGNLAREIYRIGPTRFEWGNFVTTIIEALVVALIVYLMYRWSTKNKSANIQ